MEKFRELFLERKSYEIEFNKWWDESDLDIHHFDWMQDFLRDLGRDTIKSYGDKFKAMDATMDIEQIKKIMKDISKMKKGEQVKY